MLLKGDVTSTNQKWESMPCHMGLKMGRASDRQFSRRVVLAAFGSQKRAQARHSRSSCPDATVWNEGDAYRSGNKDRLAAK
ncbi:MAG TPA: hypothetical protein VF918_17805 [Anaerolineales bacterium]